MKLTVENKKLNININVLPEKYRWHAIKYRHVVIFLGICVAVAIILTGAQYVQEALDTTASLSAEAVHQQELNGLKHDIILSDNKLQAQIAEFDEIDGKKSIFADEMSVIIGAAIAVNTEEDIVVDVVNIKHDGEIISVSCNTDIYTDQAIYTPSMIRLAEAIMETGMFYSIERDATGWQLPLPAIYELEIIREKP
jgi:hypothetical protein